MDTAKVKSMELSRDTLRHLKREPVRYFCEPLNMAVLIKPLKLRKALALIGGIGGDQPIEENVEALLRLAQEAIVDRNGKTVFESMDECEEAIGHCLLDLQEPLLAAQGLGTKEKKA